MATRLYETLELHHNASPDDIRRAYKKRALKTHPDRAPPERKLQAEEEFRQVNAAYEVLIDEEKRMIYDRHGVYPPPEPPIEEVYSNPHSHPHGMHFPPPPPQSRNSFERQSRRHAPRPDPFMQRFNESPFPSAAPPGSGPFGMHHPTFVFTDPFKMFDNVFAPAHIPFPPQHFMPLNTMSIQPSPIMQFVGGPGFLVHPDQFPSFMPTNSTWTEETRTTKIVNGREERIWTRIDREGNVRRTYDVDGRHWETLNDVIVQPYEEVYDAPRRPVEYQQAPPPPISHGRSRKSSSSKKSRYPSPPRGYTYASAPQPTPPPPQSHVRTKSHHIPSRRPHRRMYSYSQEDLGSPMSEADTVRPYSYEFASQEPPRYEEYHYPTSSREQYTKKRYEDTRLPTPPREPDVTHRRTMRPDASSMPYAGREREPAFVPPNPAEHEGKERRWWQKFKN